MLVQPVLRFTFIQFFCGQRHVKRPSRNACFLYYNSTIVQQPIDLEQLSATLLQDVKAFLHHSVDESRHDGRPFFLYYSFAHTHTPMFCHPRFKGSSKRGRMVQSPEELFWVAGSTFPTQQNCQIQRLMLRSKL